MCWMQKVFNFLMLYFSFLQVSLSSPSYFSTDVLSYAEKMTHFPKTLSTKL